MEGEEEPKELISSKWKKFNEPKTLAPFVIIVCVIITLILMAIYFGPMLGHDGFMEVHSDSMRHDNYQEDGIIDWGDTVFYDRVDSINDITTYFEGKNRGYRRYGEYGDVIVYYKNGYEDPTPIIHRAIIWIEYNQTGASFDVPELRYHDEGSDWWVTNGDERWYDLRGTLVLRNVGYNLRDVRVNLDQIINTMEIQGSAPHGGFITRGDHNRDTIDQGVLRDDQGGRTEPVVLEWIVGKVTYLIDN